MFLFIGHKDKIFGDPFCRSSSKDGKILFQMLRDIYGNIQCNFGDVLELKLYLVNITNQRLAKNRLLNAIQSNNYSKVKVLSTFNYPVAEGRYEQTEVVHYNGFNITFSYWYHNKQLSISNPTVIMDENLFL